MLTPFLVRPGGDLRLRIPRQDVPANPSGDLKTFLLLIGVDSLIARIAIV